MAIRWIRPMKPIKKVKSINSKEVLRRLQIFLESDTVMETPVRILARFWEDQQKVLGYPELRQIVQDGTVSQEALQLWSQDYSVLVANQFYPLWMDAVKAGATGQPLLDGIHFLFQTQTPGILNWIQQRGADFVTVCTEEQKQAIATLLTKKMRDRHTLDELSRMIRPCIGLTKEQAKANARYYDNIVENLKKEHPRMKLESIQKKAQVAAQKYAERQHRQRAITIAQTESAFAYHRGADEGIRQAQAQNLLGIVKKRWCTSGDDAVCEICASLDGIEIDLDTDFKIKGRILFKGQHMLPPAHPRCACAVEYIEVESRSADTRLSANDSFANTESVTQKIGEIDTEKTEEAIQYYNEVIRNLDKENVVVIDKEGNVYHAEGTASNVKISGVNFSGASITHNHPISNGIVSFGEDDFYFLREHQDIASLVCVNSTYDYFIKVLKDLSHLSYNELYIAVMKQYTFDENFEIQHEVMRLLKERGYVDYVRTLHTT